MPGRESQNDIPVTGVRHHNVGRELFIEPSVDLATFTSLISVISSVIHNKDVDLVGALNGNY